MEKHPVVTEFQQMYGNTVGANVSNRLHRCITNIWEDGNVPQAWKDASKRDRT